MRSSAHSFSASPILALQPHDPLQPTFAMNSTRSSFSSFPVNATARPQFPPRSGHRPAAAGRKRSRDEAALNLEEDQPLSLPAPENEEEWEYGEGMTLIKPSGRGYLISAASQTGTWAEEKAAEEAAAVRMPSPERPTLRSSKSQRLNLSTAPGLVEEVNLMHNPLPNAIAEPIVDEFTRHLGIGWSSISPDEDLQAAARGWGRFIENHFPVTNARIRLQSKGLASYLVQADEGYFLFEENLRQGRLVSVSLERTWDNLKASPPTFDGPVMDAAESPSKHATPELPGASFGPTSHGVPASLPLEVEMDMS